MRINITRRDLLLNEELPRGYRVAWYDCYRQVDVCYPIGIHVIAWALRRLWNATFHPLPEGEAQKLRDQIAIYEHQRLSHFDAMRALRVELRDADQKIRDLESIIRTFTPLVESLPCSHAEPS